MSLCLSVFILLFLYSILWKYLYFLPGSPAGRRGHFRTEIALLSYGNCNLPYPIVLWLFFIEGRKIIYFLNFARELNHYFITKRFVRF